MVAKFILFISLKVAVKAYPVFGYVAFSFPVYYEPVIGIDLVSGQDYWCPLDLIHML